MIWLAPGCGGDEDSESDDGLLGDDTSALNGSYELTVPTAGAPLDGYLYVSADGPGTSKSTPAWTATRCASIRSKCAPT
jgi:hypothetical protein